MSFSTEVKKELSSISNLANKQEVKQELIGYLLSGNVYYIKNKIQFSTENDYNINRFSKLLSNLKIEHNIQIKGKNFIISILLKNVPFVKVIDKKLTVEIEEEIKKQETNSKAILRGLFLGGGSINNPEKKYHLEISLSSEENLIYIKNILELFNINIKTLERGEKVSIYIKEGEEISKLLAFMGAKKAVIKFEEIRVQKQMRGKVNRLVNCETANITKTINASIMQIEAIKKLQKEHQFNKLDESLKEVAIARLENPQMSLEDLGKLLKKPIGKSGVNYRLKKIMEIANG